jgi:hypothetical protein
MSNFLNILKRVWEGVERGGLVLERVRSRMQDVDARELEVGMGWVGNMLHVGTLL